MNRWCSASSIRGTQSEMGESVKSGVNQLALSRLVAKKCKILTDILHQFGISMPPNMSGIIYRRTEQELVELMMQSKFLATRMMEVEEMSRMNSSCYPPSILNASVAPSQHVFKQPFLPVQSFRPEPIINSRDNSVLNSFAKINEQTQATIQSLSANSRTAQKVDNSIFNNNRETSMVLNGFARINEQNQATIQSLSANSRTTQKVDNSIFNNNRESSMVLNGAKINEQTQASIQSLSVNPRTTQKVDDSIFKRSNCINGRDNTIRRKGFLTKKPTKHVVQTGLSEKENLIQEDESSDVSEVSNPKRKRVQAKTNAKKKSNDLHIMPTPTTSASSRSQSPPQKIPRMQVVEKKKKEIKNVEPDSSTKNIAEKSEFDFVVKKWSLVLIDKGLRIQGDKYHRDGSTIIKSNITSGPIKSVVKDCIKTEKCVYALDGKLFDPDDAIPETIKSTYFQNGKFPKCWRKAMARWIEIQSKSEVVAPGSGSKDEGKKAKPQKVKEKNNASKPEKLKDRKKPNPKKKVKEQQTTKTTKTNGKSVLELMMTNDDSILCTSMTPNGLLNSIKKAGNQLSHTPPSKLLNDLRGSDTETSNDTDSDSDDAVKFNKPNPAVIGRVIKVVTQPNKRPQPKPKPKPKIQVETSYQEKSCNFSDLSSIEDEESD